MKRIILLFFLVFLFSCGSEKPKNLLSKDEMAEITVDLAIYEQVFFVNSQQNIDVENINTDGDCFVLNTGSPHFVKYVERVEVYNVYQNGYDIRNSANYKKEGINVNFVEQIRDNEIFVRTYERGVEAETLSCGTGVTASAITFMKDRNISSVVVKTLGGNLKVYAEKREDIFRNVWLEGPAKQVFKGNIKID